MYMYKLFIVHRERKCLLARDTNQMDDFSFT